MVGLKLSVSKYNDRMTDYIDSLTKSDTWG